MSLRPPVLIYLVTEDWYFLSHRLPMAFAARDAGFEVHVATRVGEGGARIEGHGFRLHRLDWRRGSFKPWDILRIVFEIRALYRRINPDIAHHVALQPSVIGSLAALGLPMITLNAMAGLGYGFTSRSLKARMLNLVLSRTIRWLFDRDGAAVLVQNPDDRMAIAELGVSESRISVIPGSGVDTGFFQPLPQPGNPVTLGFVGRLLDDKGVRTLIVAHDLLRPRHSDIRLLIAGTPDPANPSSIPPGEIESWKARPGVDVLGHVSDLRSFWSQVHVAVLPSRREGLPKSLLEAAACARPIVATNVPGCREIAREGVNALLVPPDDPQALANAIERLAKDEPLRGRFGAASRRLAEKKFSDTRVARDIVSLYRSLLNRAVSLAGQSGTRQKGPG